MSSVLALALECPLKNPRFSTCFWRVLLRSGHLSDSQSLGLMMMIGEVRGSGKKKNVLCVESG